MTCKARVGPKGKQACPVIFSKGETDCFQQGNSATMSFVISVSPTTKPLCRKATIIIVKIASCGLLHLRGGDAVAKLHSTNHGLQASFDPSTKRAEMMREVRWMFDSSAVGSKTMDTKVMIRVDKAATGGVDFPESDTKEVTVRAGGAIA